MNEETTQEPQCTGNCDITSCLIAWCRECGWHEEPALTE